MEKLTLSQYLMLNEGEVKPYPTNNSKIVEFFNNKTIFLTGGTGFLGKLLVEKLLRVCDNLKIYVLVRPKKGETPNERIKNLYNDIVYGPLQKHRPNFRKNISLIPGDASTDGFGLSEEDRQRIIQETDIIIHSAATVRLDAELKFATKANVKSTQTLIEIAKCCKKLICYLHVSTAYSFCNHEEIDEIFYPVPITADNLIELTENTSEENLLRLKKRLIEDWPNSYSFTKAIGESIYQREEKNLPICIIRPSIIIATYKEPLRSWIDNLYGVSGVMVGSSMGILHTLHGAPEKVADVVPADYVVNAAIAAIYETVRTRPKNIPIYNYVSGAENPITWKEFTLGCSHYAKSTPPKDALWYYGLHINKSKIIHLVSQFWFQWFPGFLIDVYLVLTGKKPKMITIYKKISKFTNVVACYFTKEWKFHNNNVKNLWQSLDDVDKQIFPFSMKLINWEIYQITHFYGIRTYLMKDDPATVPEARKRFRKLFLIHSLLKIAFWLFLLKLLQGIFNYIFSLYL